jgi:nitrite reductase/ring-hydroxylating ferredoxin subunit
LEDGKALAPDEGTTQSIAVRVIDGDIYVHLPELVTGARV